MPARSRAAAGSVVRQTGSPATTRGAGRPAAAVALVSTGTVWSASVAGPVIQVTVPSANSPAIRSMTGPRAATSSDGAAAPGTMIRALTRIVSPANDTRSPSSSGPRTDRYSRMCRAGLE